MEEIEWPAGAHKPVPVRDVRGPLDFSRDSTVVARPAHNRQVGGSNPPPATNNRGVVQPDQNNRLLPCTSQVRVLPPRPSFKLLRAYLGRDKYVLAIR